MTSNEEPKLTNGVHDEPLLNGGLESNESAEVNGHAELNGHADLNCEEAVSSTNGHAEPTELNGFHEPNDPLVINDSL